MSAPIFQIDGKAPAVQMVHEALNVLIWKLPLHPSCKTPEEMAQFIVAELRDKGNARIAWDAANCRFTE